MEVTAKAPGKIILSGEHAVVHGSAAVASSIDLCTTVTLRFPSHTGNDGNLKLQLKDLSLEFSWPIARLEEFLGEENDADASKPTPPGSLTSKLRSLVEEQNVPEAKIGLASVMEAFLWLYTRIQGCKPATVIVTSDLPLGSGLGSSAAYCVALSGSLLALSNCVKGDVNLQTWQGFEDDELLLLNRWAFEGEKIIHGKPSGIDNTVSTYGNMIKFKSGNLTFITSSLPLRMLITNTKVGRNTKALVVSVSERTKRHPDAMNSVFAAVESISNELAEIIQSPTPTDLAMTEYEESIGELMEMNQGLLQCMGVSHTSIETVLRTTLKYKLTSKLTGAGGGGCVLTLLPTLLSPTVVEKVIAELESSGFQCMIAGIGRRGVQVCFNLQPDCTNRVN